MDAGAASVGTEAPLSALLRKETKVAHRLAEGTRLARAFFTGKLTVARYAEGLARLYPVYVAMEDALCALAADHPLRGFCLPRVFRADAMLADLRHFGVSPEPLRAGAATRYHARIVELTQPTQTLLVAHAYVRYMGDVSGGIIAGRVAQRVLRLPSREGLAFFAFDGIPDPDVFRREFRALLDALPRDRAETRAIVAEANLAFDLNRALAEEVWDA
ncbi:MAG: biliverdin-producing heme oxygenase [Labilithrix sp.]|nr:biliverdin-producing heme oxygenase [Labilithrix sp.]